MTKEEDNKIVEKLNRIETDVFLIKEMNLLANEDLFVEKLKKVIGRSKNKARILLSCFLKSKTQKQLCEELQLDKGNLNKIIKELTDQRMIYPVEIGKSKLIQPSFSISKRKLRSLIGDLFEKDIDFVNQMELKYLY